MPPRVTVVIPTFNRFEYLLSAIESCIAQTEEVKIIVVDHGSSDATISIAKRFEGKVRYIRREFDSGPHFSWLDGCLLADTELVKLLFDDDTLEPNYIEETASLFSPSVGFVFSAATIVNEAGEPEGKLFSGILPSSGLFFRHRDIRRIKRPLISPSAAIFRKEDLVDSLFINKLPIQERVYHGVGPDHFVKLVALMRRPQFGFVDKPLANFRSHPGSITIASARGGRSADLKLAYLDVSNVALLLQLISRFKILSVLRAFEPVIGKGRTARETLRRVQIQVRAHGLVPLRLRNRFAVTDWSSK